MNIEKAIQLSSLNQAGYIDNWGNFHLFCDLSGYWVREAGPNKSFKFKRKYPRPSKNWKPIAP